MAAPACELVSVTKGFGQRTVIRAMDLSVADGEMVAISGRSGSGKSTLLNLVGLLEPIDDGTLRLFGEIAPKVGSGSATKLLRYRLGYLFQNFALIDDESVDANLRLAQAYVKMPRARRDASRADALRRVGLADVGHQKVYELSGGEQQRVAIARLMLKPCDLILADEPTGSLDVANADVVLALLKELNAIGKTVIVVTHDERVVAACDRVVALPDMRGGDDPIELRARRSA